MSVIRCEAELKYKKILTNWKHDLNLTERHFMEINVRT